MAKVLERRPETLNGALMQGNGLKELYEFCLRRNKIYILGAGKIGNGIKHYLNQIDVPFDGFIVSDTLPEFSKKYVVGKTGVIVGVDDVHLSEMAPLLKEFVPNDDIFALPIDLRQDMFVRNSPDYIKENLCLVLNIIDNCNLNCAYCRNFAPLAKSSARAYGDIEADVKQLKAVGITHLFKIFISGGEPLMHPDLFRVLALCRAEYPNAVIECNTNGVLFKRLTSEQLKKFVELKIVITYTEYPVQGIDHEYFYRTVDAYGIDYVSINHRENVDSDNKNKLFVKCTMNFDKGSPKYCYFYCTRKVGRATVFLRDGKLYTCHTTESIGIFNSYFSRNLEVTEDDFLDLCTAAPEEIYEFKRRRIPFCGYCDIEKNEQMPYRISRKEIEEWT
jgi:organic radical activating enzyme